MSAVLERKVTNSEKDLIMDKLSLITEIKCDGFENAIRYQTGEAYDYLISIVNYSNEELAAEKNRLRNELYM